MRKIETQIDEMIKLLTDYKKMLASHEMPEAVAKYDIRELMEHFLETL